MIERKQAPQIRASLKSPWRGTPGARDTGERFEVRYRDGMGQDRSYGYADTPVRAQQIALKCGKNPMFKHVRILDRGPR